jgi:hypothetical protein
MRSPCGPKKQRALGDAGRSGEAGEGHIPLLPQPLQSRANLLKGSGDGVCCGLHLAILAVASQDWQRKLRPHTAPRNLARHPHRRQ